MSDRINVSAVRAKVTSNREHYKNAGEQEMVDSCDVMLRFISLAEAANNATELINGVLVFCPNKKYQLKRALEHFEFPPEELE